MKVADLVGRLRPEESPKNERFRVDGSFLNRLVIAYKKSFRNQGIGSLLNQVHLAKSVLSNVQNIDAAYPQLVYEALRFEKSTRRNPFWYSFLGVLCTKCDADPTLRISDERAAFGGYMSFGDKKVTVIGDLFSAGYQMKSGHLRIKGDVGDLGGMLEGGVLEVNGNVDKFGCGMTGGTISIKGDFGYYSPSEIKGGKVYINNKLVYGREP